MAKGTDDLQGVDEQTPVGAALPKTPEPEKPVFTIENQPKTKEEWDQLWKEDPSAWKDITQHNFNSSFKKTKELEEQVEATKTREKNLMVELEAARKPAEPVDPAVPQPFSRENLPQTEEQWRQLNQENPVLFHDLREHANKIDATVKEEFRRDFKNSAQIVQREHPDMYLPEVDEQGNPKKDDKGNIILKVDANGYAIVNEKSEKYLIYDEEYKKDPSLGMFRDGPEILMGRMERRLRAKGQAVVNAAKADRQNQVAPEGLQPPKPVGPLKFSSDREKEHAEKAVQRGVYRNLEEYCQLRDNQDAGIYDENRTPSFKK